MNLKLISTTAFSMVMFALVITAPGYAGASVADENSIYVRFLGGYTYSAKETEPAGFDPAGYHYGFQIFERIGPKHSIGFEWTLEKLYSSSSGDYLVTLMGVTLEQKFMDNLIATISASGYFDAEDFDGAFFGVRVGFGYETSFSLKTFMTILVRQEYIFASDTIETISGTIAFGMNF